LREAHDKPFQEEHPMRKITKRSAATLAATVIAIGGGTAAFAYATGWFKGSGDVKATSSAIQTVTAVVDLPSSDPAKRLFPGRTFAVTGTVTNPNDYKVRINSASVSGISATKADNSVNSACGSNGSAGLALALPSAGLVINPGTGTPNVALGNLSMAEGASPDCANSRITATLTLTGELIP
jgi:hypothetical protein